MSETHLARIVTFYSYKGGTGRSMALANVAWILASAGKRVLVIDWDLEAPGLHRYFDPFLEDPDLLGSDGLIDFFIKFAAAAVATEEDPDQGSDPPWFEPYANLMYYAYSVKHPFAKPGCLEIVPAGRQDGNYAVRVNGFNWDRFFTVFGGGVFLESVKQKLRKEYDFILIDSRTGVSDTAGICGVQMPDDLVVCYTLNRQSILGSAAVASSAFAQRKTAHGPTLKIWPVPTRLEDAEKLKRDRMHAYAVQVFQEMLPQIRDKEGYWGNVRVPYQPFYAYEEVLAVFGDPPYTTGSMLAAFEALTSHITDGAVDKLAHQSEKTRLAILERFPGLSVNVTPEQARKPAIPALEVQPGHRYLCFVSHSAIDGGDLLLPRFIADLNHELQVRTGQKIGLCFVYDEDIPMVGDLQQVLRFAIDQCDVFLALMSPSYFKSDWLEFEVGYAKSSKKAILAVEWSPTDSASTAPTWATEIRRSALRDAIGTKSSAGIGIRGLLRQYSRLESEYHAMVDKIADQVLALSRPSFALPEQKDDDPVRGQVEGLAKEYVALRRKMKSGSERTRLMEAVVQKMRAVVPGAKHLMPRLTNSEDPGERLAAIAYLQIHPTTEYLNWLVTRVDPAYERPFVGYHAAVALRASVHALSAFAADELYRCINKAIELIGRRPNSDRDRTLKLALSELQKIHAQPSPTAVNAQGSAAS